MPPISTVYVSPSGSMTRRRRVLVIGEDPDTALSLTELLRDMGAEVKYAINGRAALAIAERFLPDLVFVDMLAPELDRNDLSHRLRVLVAPRRIKVVAVTGSGSDEIRARAMRAGCDEYILKPLDSRSLQPLLDTK